MKSSPATKTNVACLQFEPSIGELDKNRQHALSMIEQAADAGADLIVLPELSDSGYVFESREEAYRLASDIGSSPTVEAWCEVASRRGVYIVGGFCEQSGEVLYNSAAVIGPNGVIGSYRKLHLWGEEALYFERGNLGVPVFATRFGRLSALICYDGWFPEAWRMAALQGADIVCVPTNWVPMPSQPEGQMSMSNILCMAAAHSNSLYVAAACRIGIERQQLFIGQSLIVNHEGWPVAGPAPQDDECMLMAEVDLAEARRQRSLNSFNQLMRDRRIDVYGEMLGADARPGWY